MKVIQSFWSGNQSDINSAYGWLSNKHHWLSWILSSNQLSKHHSNLELYTDSFGYEVLIKKMKLPYSKVHVVLDELNCYHKDLWAVAKIKTYELQDKPFLHVDGDVFVWDSLTKNFKNSDLITQNLEKTTNYYVEMWKLIKPELKFLPAVLNDKFNDGYACNMGIVGGTNISFFKEYAQKSFEIVNKNKEIWESINCLNFNIFFEQVLFYRLLKSKKIKVDYIFNKISEDNNYVGFGDFDKVPDKTYLHLLGDYKRNTSVCRKMEVYIMKYYPTYYSNLMGFLGKEVYGKKEREIISRDLFNEGMPILFDRFLKFALPFYLKRIDQNIKEPEKLSIIDIEEIDSKNEIYETDEIDLIMLDNLKDPILYNKFITKIKVYLAEDNEKIKNTFLELINNRLRNYISIKIITISFRER